jgi:hypothetical protein
MQSLTSTTGLKDAIRQLEYEKSVQEKLIKENFNLVLENLKPINLIKNTLNEIVTSRSILSNIFITAFGLTFSYFSKKKGMGSGDSLLNKLFGTLIQLGVANIIIKNPDLIKSVGQRLMKFIFSKKE